MIKKERSPLEFDEEANEIIIPNPDYIIKENDRLVIFGEDEKIKATEVITTYGSAIPVPYEMLPPEVQFLIGTGPEGLAEITIITTY